MGFHLPEDGADHTALKSSKVHMPPVPGGAEPGNIGWILLPNLSATGRIEEFASGDSTFQSQHLLEAFSYIDFTDGGIRATVTGRQ